MKSYLGIVSLWAMCGGLASCTATGSLFNAVEALYDELSASDVTFASINLQSALENAHDGDVRSWQNPATGNGGEIRVRNTFVDQRGAFCRNYSETLSLQDGRQGQFSNTACRNPDGGWIWI